MNKNLEKIGSVSSCGVMQIIDPCFDVAGTCYIETQCKSGEYEVFISRKNNKVAEIYAICGNNDFNININIGRVAVDSGLCGFYANKRNFTFNEWMEFCDKIGNDDYLEDYGGVCCSSGWGDGEYNVYTNKERNAFMIKFI